jgi:hypothetical protein
MRIEGRGHDGASVGRRSGAREVEQRAMPAVHADERTERDDG